MVHFGSDTAEVSRCNHQESGKSNKNTGEFCWAVVFPTRMLYDLSGERPPNNSG